MSIVTRRIGFAVAALCCGAVVAHEFWLEASAFRLRRGETLSIRTLIGDGLPGEARPRDPTKLERFEILGPDGVEKVPGDPGAEPVGSVKPTAQGRYVVAYCSRPTKITLEASKFNAYLEEEGLDSALEARRASGGVEREGRERYARCAKALVRVGEADAGSFDRPAGFAFELIPESDPYALAPGGQFTIRAVADGEPVAGTLVKAFHASRPKSPLEARTDASGRAVFKLDQGGFWLVSSVRMTPTKEDGCDWESLWASVTFEVPAARESTPAQKR